MTLEVRYCACLCGKKWRTIASSPNWFWSEGHVERAEISGVFEVREKAAAHREWRRGISFRPFSAKAKRARRIANLFSDFEIERMRQKGMAVAKQKQRVL